MLCSTYLFAFNAEQQSASNAWNIFIINFVLPSSVRPMSCNSILSHLQSLHFQENNFFIDAALFLHSRSVVKTKKLVIWMTYVLHWHESAKGQQPWDDKHNRKAPSFQKLPNFLDWRLFSWNFTYFDKLQNQK